MSDPFSDEERVVVIGSGPSGAVAAMTLVQRGIRVTMLESGSARPGGLVVRANGRNVFRLRASASKRHAFVSTGDPETQWHNALAPGGLSNYWTGAVPRFAPEDFLEGERLHERYRWPISYGDLASYYERMERLLYVVGDPREIANLPGPRVSYARVLPSDWQAVGTRAASFGHGLTRMPLADGPPWMLRRTAYAFNSFGRIVRSLLHSRIFDLQLGTHALRLEWQGAQKRVTSVTIFDRATRSVQRLSCAAVIVAAGPLGSAKLLLDSTGPDFPEGLGDLEGLLGRYLHDHSNDWCVVELDRPLSRLGHPAYLTRAPYAESEPLRAAAVTIGPSSPVERIRSLAPGRTHRFGLVTFGTMVPTTSNHVGLDGVRKDEFGLPVLTIHLSYDDGVRQTSVRARERLLAILESAGYRGKIECPVPRLVPGTSAHFGGTVRMHSSPKHGMLDGWNRLHHVRNVVVADASAFTTGVEKNPTLTAMALAARAADRLAGDLTQTLNRG